MHYSDKPKDDKPSESNILLLIMMKLKMCYGFFIFNDLSPNKYEIGDEMGVGGGGGGDTGCSSIGLHQSMQVFLHDFSSLK
jgi:hypothetical protein